MTLPTLSINGTHKSELFAAALEAKEKLEEALTALKKTCPNGRDYQYAAPGTFDRALGEHAARTRFLEWIISDMEQLAEHTQ